MVQKFDKFSETFRVLGKKLIDWTLEYLLAVNPKIDVIISSPDEDVLNFIKIKNPRLIPIFRPSQLASANILLSASIKDAVNEYKKIKKKKS